MAVTGNEAPHDSQWPMFCCSLSTTGEGRQTSGDYNESGAVGTHWLSRTERNESYWFLTRCWYKAKHLIGLVKQGAPEFQNHKIFGKCSLSLSFFTTNGLPADMSRCRARSGTCNQILLPVGRLLSESCGLASVGRPLWREDGYFYKIRLNSSMNFGTNNPTLGIVRALFSSSLVQARHYINWVGCTQCWPPGWLQIVMIMKCMELNMAYFKEELQHFT
jgi:hypothetical protein